MVENVPVITIDGPAASGKGTLGQRLARHLGFNFLDSGIVYRVLAYGLQQKNIPFKKQENKKAIITFAKTLSFEIVMPEKQAAGMKVLWEGQDISAAIRSPVCSDHASQISAIPSVRKALMPCQRAFKKPPGLVTDGRDMGTVVFPDACLKIFLTASLSVRAKRRFHELQEKHINVSLEHVLAELAKRDERDEKRAIAPLKPSVDASIMDATHLTAQEVFDAVCQKINHVL